MCRWGRTVEPLLQRTAGWCEAVQDLRKITPEHAAESRFYIEVYSRNGLVGSHGILPLQGSAVLDAQSGRLPAASGVVPRALQPVSIERRVFFVILGSVSAFSG